MSQEITVGRNPSSDIVIDNALISGKHLRIFKLDSMVFIEDLGSVNGTLLNGELLSKGEKKIISKSSHILLAKKVPLDLNHHKIKALGFPLSSQSEEKEVPNLEDKDFFDEESLFIAEKKPKKTRWGLFGVLSTVAISSALCFSGKFDTLCNRVFFQDEVVSESPIEKVENYLITPPKFMGSSKSNDSILFTNRKDETFVIELISISVEGIPYDGILSPLNGKVKFLLFPEKTYEYKLVFEDTLTKDLDSGSYSSKVIFKVTGDESRPKMETVTFPLEIVN